MLSKYHIPEASISSTVGGTGSLSLPQNNEKISTMNTPNTRK